MSAVALPLPDVAPSEKRFPAPLRSVLLVTPWFRPDIGGVVEVSHRLLRGLSAAGVATHLVVSKETAGTAIVPDPTYADVWRTYLPCSFFGGRATSRRICGTLLRGVTALRSLYRFFEEQRVDRVVLVYPTDTSWLFLVLRSLLDIRVILSCHGSDLMLYDTYPPQLRWLLRRALAAADRIIVSAPMLAAQARRIARDADLPITVIWNCVDVAHFRPPSGPRTPGSPPTLVHVSNFTPRKRVQDIVAAFAMAKIPSDSRLIMIGAGPELSAAQACATKLGVGHRALFVGSQTDVRPFLQCADLFVMASESETGPISLLEAMACGVPWVSTPCGIPGNLPHGESGLLVPAGSPPAAAKAIAEIINDPARRRRMGMRARERAVSDFSEERYLSQHLKVLSQVRPRNGAHSTS